MEFDSNLQPPLSTLILRELGGGALKAIDPEEDGGLQAALHAMQHAGDPGTSGALGNEI